MIKQETSTNPVWKTQYDAEGYCIIDNAYDDSLLQEIEAFFEDYRAGGGELIPGVRYEDFDMTQRQVRCIHPHRRSEQAKAWLLHPPVAEVLRVLMGERDPLAVQTMYYYKPPGARGQGMHQDNFYLIAEPATCVAAWTPIDDATEENGCLWGVPRSQLGNILCPKERNDEVPRWMNYGDSHIEKFPRDLKPIPIPVKRGQTMFFNGNFIHGSGPNRTKDRSRRTFIGHYCDEATERIAQFYHPVLNMRGEAVSDIEQRAAGGPCGDSHRATNYH